MQTGSDTKQQLNREFDGFVTCLGASAGGLEALEQFFSRCPTDMGVAFVVVQHLSPDHKSMMQDLLRRYTDMHIAVVTDGMPIRANTVHLIPAGMVMQMRGDRFSLSPKLPHTLTLPIDIYLNSLADEFGNRSVAIILSGTGSDGSRGAAAINAAGGFIMAQAPETAKFDGMPASVLSTGLVDAVLPPDELPQRLDAYINAAPEASIVQKPFIEVAPISENAAYDAIQRLLIEHSGIDFKEYKIATLLRRIERRMQVHHCTSVEAYLELLNGDPGEVSMLRRELLIPVTRFFRDSETFDCLKTQVVDKLVSESANGQTLRVWVAGTSTGEEAYSIAMLFLEAFEAQHKWPNLKIFATDVSQESIDFAALGLYSDSIVTELSTARLERFFTQVGNAYQVKPELRQTIVFARHNLLADPPFTQIDLISCRNALIYFTQDAQRKIFQRFEFSARRGSYLLLGSSESTPSEDKGFAVIDGKHKIYQRSDSFANYHSRTYAPPSLSSSYQPAEQAQKPRKNPLADENILIDQATDILINQYAAPSMLISNRNQIIHLFGNIQPYFQVRKGNASLDIKRVLPEQLAPMASALIFKAANDQARMVSNYIQLTQADGSTSLVRLVVNPVALHQDESLLLLSFEEKSGDSRDDVVVAVDVDKESMVRIDLLEKELQATRESLQATIEQLELSNEELQATNEELMASNEELQSSNEELQSVNEELNTVNAEYHEKVSILNRLNADLDGMTKAVSVATVFVDHSLALTRYSDDALKIFKLRDTDIGRPLDEINNLLHYPNLMIDIANVIATERMLETQVTAQNGNLYIVRIMPYRSSSKNTGAVATFVDISAFRDRDRLQAILNALPEHIAVIADSGEIVMVNTSWERFARANGDSELQFTGVGCNYLKTCTGGERPDKDAVSAHAGILSVLEGSKASFSMTYPCHSPEEERWFVMSVAPVGTPEFAAVVSHFNISAWMSDKRNEQPA
jgi:two-component system CheB/CheR fusion protein